MVLVAQKKRPHTVAHKRRHGEHHRRTPEYHKTYWPYLPLGLIIGLGMLVNAFWPSIQNVLGYATNTSVSGLLQATNSERSAGSLGALAVNEQLNRAAQAKANDMAARNYWSHDTPDGSPPWVFFNQAGYAYEAAGENLAYGFDNSNATIAAWMNSPGHRANIMNSGFKEVGFGMANVQDYQGSGPQTIVVAMYGAPLVPLAAAPAPTNSPAPAASKPATQTPAPTTAEREQIPTTPEPETITPEIAMAQDQPVPQALESQNVSRVQVLSGGSAPWSLAVITILMAAAALIFFLRHGVFWHKALVKGERFVIKHHLLDVGLVALGVIGFILTRSMGAIH